MDSVPRALVHCEKPVKQQKNTGTWLKPLEMWPESHAGSTHLLVRLICFMFHESMPQNGHNPWAVPTNRFKLCTKRCNGCATRQLTAHPRLNVSCYCLTVELTTRTEPTNLEMLPFTRQMAYDLIMYHFLTAND
jgi:hypothetical protein